MIVLEAEVCIEYLQVGYSLICGVEEMDEGNNSKEVLHDWRYKWVKEETTKSVERMVCYGTMGLPATRGDCGCRHSQWHGIR
jgi:hypothetical protein